MLFHSEAGSFYKTSNHLQGWNLYFCLILNMPTNFYYKFTQSVNSLSTSINAENRFCRHFSPTTGSQCPAQDVSSLQTCSTDPYDHFEPLGRVLTARILHFSILFPKMTLLNFHVFLICSVIPMVLNAWMQPICHQTTKQPTNQLPADVYFLQIQLPIAAAAAAVGHFGERKLVMSFSTYKTITTKVVVG